MKRLFRRRPRPAIAELQFAAPRPVVAAASRPAPVRPAPENPEPARPASRKAALLAQATREFSATPRPSPADIARYKEFFYQMIDGCGPVERRALAASLGINPYVPRPIVFYLAIDEKDVAAPILLFSPAINEADIGPLSARLSLEHLLILCRRADLTPASAEVLMTNGGQPAARVLSRNFATAAFPAVQAAMASEREAGKPAREEPAAEAAQPPAAGTRDHPSARRLAAAGLAAGLHSELVDLAGRGGRLGRARPQAAPATAPASGPDSNWTPQQALAARLLSAARRKDRHALAEALAQAARLPLSAVERVLASPNAEIVCVLLKGVGVEDPPASQIAVMLAPESAGKSDALAAAASLFRRLDAGHCTRFVEALRGVATKAESRLPVTAPAVAVPGARANGEAFARALAERRKEIARPAEEGGPRRTFGRLRRSA